MSSPFVAEIRMFASNFAPTGWAQCVGQLMPISQNTALFSLLGTQYGGDGRSTFALPNFDGMAPMGHDQGPGLSQRFIGETAGSETVTLLQSEIPLHTHQAQVTTQLGSVMTPDATTTLGRTSAKSYTTTPGSTVQMAGGIAGSSFPHNNMQPYLTVTFCIALQGVFPPRS